MKRLLIALALVAGLAVALRDKHHYVHATTQLELRNRDWAEEGEIQEKKAVLPRKKRTTQDDPPDPGPGGGGGGPPKLVHGHLHEEATKVCHGNNCPCNSGGNNGGHTVKAAPTKTIKGPRKGRAGAGQDDPPDPGPGGGGEGPPKLVHGHLHEESSKVCHGGKCPCDGGDKTVKQPKHIDHLHEESTKVCHGNNCPCNSGGKTVNGPRKVSKAPTKAKRLVAKTVPAKNLAVHSLIQKSSKNTRKHQTHVAHKAHSSKNTHNVHHHDDPTNPTHPNYDPCLDDPTPPESCYCDHYPTPPKHCLPRRKPHRVNLVEKTHTKAKQDSGLGGACLDDLTPPDYCYCSFYWPLPPKEGCIDDDKTSFHLHLHESKSKTHQDGVYHGGGHSGAGHHNGGHDGGHHDGGHHGAGHHDPCLDDISPPFYCTCGTPNPHPECECGTTNAHPNCLTRRLRGKNIHLHEEAKPTHRVKAESLVEKTHTKGKQPGFDPCQDDPNPPENCYCDFYPVHPDWNCIERFETGHAVFLHEKPTKDMDDDKFLSQLTDDDSLATFLLETVDTAATDTNVATAAAASATDKANAPIGVWLDATKLTEEDIKKMSKQ